MDPALICSAPIPLSIQNSIPSSTGSINRKSTEKTNTRHTIEKGPQTLWSLSWESSGIIEEIEDYLKQDQISKIKMVYAWNN